MDIRTFPLSDLNPAPYNPRTIDPAEKERLETSLRTFGYVDPLIVNTRDDRNVVVGGNQRYDVLTEMGVEEVEVVVVDLSVEEEMALNVALNRISGRWEYDKLAAVLTAIQASPLDILTTGFSQTEIDAMLNLDEDFSFDLGEPEDDDGGEAADVTGGIENRTYVCHVYFDTRENAERFLRFIGAENPTIREYTTMVPGEKLVLPEDV